MKNLDGDPFKVHLNSLIGRNKDYFEHLGGSCVCAMCICGRCKCPKKNLTSDYLRGNNSEYQTKYVPHKCLDNLPTLKGDFFTSNYSKTPLDYSTTHRVYNNSQKFIILCENFSRWIIRPLILILG